HVFYFVEWHVFFELDGQSLAVTAHRTDAYTNAVHRDRIRFEAKYLVCFGRTFPFLAALAIAEILVDPRQQAAGERMAEMPGRKILLALHVGNRAVDIENRGIRLVELRPGGVMQYPHLPHQLSHVLRAGAGRGLVSHRRQPL